MLSLSFLAQVPQNAGAKVQQFDQMTKFLTKYFKKNLYLLPLLHFQIAVNNVHTEVIGSCK